MSSFNQCVFVGNVGREPERKQTEEGISFTRFPLAVDGGKDQEPLWITVVAWRTLADQVEKYVGKGSLVLVSGKLAVRSFTSKDNVEKTAVELVASDVRFLGPKTRGTEKRSSEPEADREPVSQ